jgi:hypothetical protein
MKNFISVVVAVAALSSMTAGCHHYHPAPLRSARDIDRASSSENVLVVARLPLKDWKKLQKFTGLEHFLVAEEIASEITDDHLKALSRLELPKVSQVSLAHCRQVTDAGLQTLTNLSSVQGFQLIGTSITDRSMLTLAAQFPNLRGINVESCKLVTELGFLNLTNSRTMTAVRFSLESFSQAQVENIISTVSNVISWTISDPRQRLDQAQLRQLAYSRKIKIEVAH